jgi:hypothetical protein
MLNALAAGGIRLTNNQKRYGETKKNSNVERALPTHNSPPPYLRLHGTLLPLIRYHSWPESLALLFRMS